MPPLRFDDHVLLKASEIQGDQPPGSVPVFPESELVAAFVGTAYEASARDRGVLIKAMTELKHHGWMDLMQVQGPWSWQLTSAGQRRSDQIRDDEKLRLSNGEAVLRTKVLEAYAAQSRKVAPGSMPPVLDVAEFCRENLVSADEFFAQASRLLDQGLLDLKGLRRDALTQGLGFLTERGRQHLDAPPPGAAPTRTTAELYQQIARLKRELEVAGTQPENLIRDPQLKDRVAGLLAVDRNFDTAVREATVILEDRVRAKSGCADLSGLDLMTAAFKEENGRLIISQVPAEQAGVHMTFRGIIGWVRNSFHHRVIDATAQGDAMRIIAFVDWLLEEVDRAVVR